MLAELLSPNVHDFLERELAGTEQRAIVGPRLVRVGNVIDNKVEVRSAAVELGNEGGLTVLSIRMWSEFDCFQAANGIFF